VVGSGQLVRQVNIGDFLVLFTQVKPVESTRDLGHGVLDNSMLVSMMSMPRHRYRQLSLSAQVTALCRSGFRSASDRISCIALRAHNNFGDRSSAATGPRVWNAMPCRHICDRTRATDISSSQRKETCLDCRRTRRIVNIFVRLRSSLRPTYTKRQLGRPSTKSIHPIIAFA